MPASGGDRESRVQDVPGTSSAYAERVTGGGYRNNHPEVRSPGALPDYLRRLPAGDRQCPRRRDGDHRRRRARAPQRQRTLSARATRRSASEVFVPSAAGMIPTGQLASIELRNGPPGITTENTLLAAYVLVDIRDRDAGSCVRDAQHDDRGGDHGRTAADHVLERHRFGGDDSHRRTDGRRHGLVDGTSPSHLSHRRRLGGCRGPLQERFAATCSIRHWVKGGAPARA